MFDRTSIHFYIVVIWIIFFFLMWFVFQQYLLNTDELMKNIISIEENLEPQGNISVIPKSQKRPVQANDLKISTKYEGLTIPLIIDGTIIEKNLQHVNLTKEWLEGELNKQGITDIKEEVNLAELDTSGQLLVSRNISEK